VGGWVFLFKDALFEESAPEGQALSQFQKIPDVEVKSLRGESSTLQKRVQEQMEAEGTQRIILSLWATWCPPCLKEIPELSERRSDYKKNGTSILLISFDRIVQPSDREMVESWLKEHKIKLPVEVDPKEALIEELNLSALPFNAIVEKDLKILWSNEGILNFEEIEKKFHSHRAK